MDPEPIDANHPAGIAEFAFESHGSKLNAILYLAQGAGPHPTAILLHGFPGNERNLDLAQVLRRVGWNVLFFHYRGAWGSEGEFSFDHALEDVATSIALVGSTDFVEEHRGDAHRIALVGHSMGGFLALFGASESAAVDCVASLAGANLGLVGRALREDPTAAERAAATLDGWSGPLHGARGDLLAARVQKNADAWDTTQRAAALARKHVLMVAGSRDVVTPPSVHHEPLVQALQDAGARSLRTEVLPTDHAFSDRRIALARLLSDWISKDCAVG